MKRLLTGVVSICLAATMLLGGCDKADDNAATGSADTLVVAHSQGEWAWPILDEIINEYKELTGTTVELQYVPGDSFSQWQAAQFMANNEPDILWGSLEVNTYYNSGKIMKLTEYYNKPSKYTGNIWKDDYIDGTLDRCVDEGGKEYIQNPIATTPVTLYYNKDIFEDLNMTPPTNWTEMFQAMETVKEKGDGIIPFSCMNSTPWNLDWFIEPVLEDLFANTDVLSKLDVIQKNQRLDKTEAILGLKTGIIKFTDKPFVTYFQLMKDMIPYLNTGFNAASFEFESLFNDGKAAMTTNGAWYPNQHLTQELSVNYGVVPLPYVDKAIDSTSRDKAVKYKPTVAGGLAVTAKAEKEGKGEKAVDFLQYLSDPNGGGKTWYTKTMFMPVIKNVEVPEVLQEAVACVGDTPIVYSGRDIFNCGQEVYVKYCEEFCKFMENEQSPEEFAQEVQELYNGYIDEIIATSEVDIMSYAEQVK